RPIRRRDASRCQAAMTRLRRLLLPLLLAASVAAPQAAASRCPVDQDRWDASNKALTAAVVFQGRLLAKSVDAAGNLLARFRVQKVLKPGATSSSSSSSLRRRQEVVVALGSGLGPRRRTLCPVSVPQGFVFNARYLVYANPVAGRAARRLLLPAAANFSAAATPDHYTRRAGRAVKKVVCEGCGE
ncbi:unnamed protein product, partial [Ixodes hexagonus]